ncbi:MAG: single-stranded-DNA-specific exonuclease RecJ [Deltaproteobacteria bacterium]|jgi:single-stranded-DNA-specific exonuclease|nr:single-stranded-DNA-specific exonuclease RecJ [Deltaproteobacteria bacterium]
MKSHWHMFDPDPHKVKELSQKLSCHPVTASVLINRDIHTIQAATHFLNASLNSIRSPFALKDMDVAIHRIHKAISANEKILIFGDYDVDGITATVILLNFLRYAGADVSYYIPHRVTEGYSIQPGHISRYARPHKIDLIITADCGSDSHQTVAAAKRFGIDMIITDHHTITENIPPALAVINPKRRDCPAGLQNLAGVGVAFFLLICLRTHLREKGFWQERLEPNLKNYCDLVALGTVADMVPLIEENRILCKTGLKLIPAGRRTGLAALMEASAIHNDFLDADDIAFRLAPRLNAAGRMDHAARAVELLTAKDTDIAGQTAHTLNLLNQKRRQIEQSMLADIQGFLENNSSILQRRALVLSGQGWHVGVLGIVASQIVNAYYRPVVLITIRDGIGIGSGRSVAGLNLYDALASCKPYLESFGGHSMAAGLKIGEENIADFQKAFESVIRRISQPEDLTPTLHIDSELDFDIISDTLVNELETLMPFGAGNPEPLFRTADVTVVSSKIVGKNHRRMILRQSSTPNTPVFQAIQFNVDSRVSNKHNFSQIVYKLRWNRWKDRKTTQLVVEDMQ